MTAVRTLTLLLAALIATQCSLGQSIFGSIVGTVKDPGQRSVPGAQIRLSGLDDKSTRSVAADSDGAFELANVKAGRYEIVVHANGFTDYEMNSIQLEARQTLRLDVALEIASQTQTVEVSSSVEPAINTENAAIGDSKDFKDISNLPVNYRGATTSPLAMLATVPGAEQDANGNVSLGGGLPSQVQYSVDGSSTVNIRQNGALGNMNPSSELIDEFKVTEFNNNAEFAQAGDVTITTKNGTAHFHGSLYEYAQNSAFDATTYGSTLNGANVKPHKAFNTFGGSLGGPLAIRGSQRKNPRTFFFVDYEGNRRRLSTALFEDVPSAAMRSGNFTGVLDSSGNQVTLTDPFTHQPYANNQIPSGGQCATAQDCLNPLAASLLANYIPLPNTAAPGVNYLQETFTPSNTNGYDVRIDGTLTSKQSVFARWSWKNVSTTLANPILPADQDLEQDRNLIVSHNYVISDNLINEARFGLSLFQLQVNFPIAGAQAISTLGLQGLDLSDHPTTDGFPTFNFSDGTGLTPVGRDKAGLTQSQTIQLADNLTWIHGKHTTKFGADVRRVYYRDLESFGGSDDFGAFTFNQGAFTGNAFADFLLGLPSKTYVAQSGPDVHAYAIETGLYAQDEFRLNEQLTLSFGLRWQALPPFVSEDHNLTAFDLRNGGIIIPSGNQPRAGFLASINTCVPGSADAPCGGPLNPALNCAPVNPALPCAPVELAGSLGLGPGLREFYSGNFQPRIGFAYRPLGNNRTVVRGGFGIFTMTNLGQLSFNTTNIDVAVVRTTQNSFSGGQPAYQFPSAGTANNPSTLAGTGDFYQNTLTNYRDPQSAQWNLTLERELVNGVTLRESYVGMNSYRMSQTVDLNQVEPSPISPNPNPKPYANWGRILSTENGGDVNYEGLQSELNVRARGGLSLQASEVWAKSLGNVGGDAPTEFSPEVIYGTPVANRFDLAANRGNISQTRRNRLLVTGMYDLPIGRSRRFLRNMGRFSEAAFGGWSLSTVTLWQTGPYLTPITSPSYDPGNLSLVYRGAYQRPDCIGNPNVPTKGSMFNLAAFNPIPAGPVGDCAVGSLLGPGTTAVAAGLSKNFQFGERVRVRFEGTFTNLLNHPNFAPPSTDVTSPSTFGVLTSAQSAENSGNRTGQVSLRLEF
jgi:hypothetical protein